MTRAVLVIPARYGSTRLPAKPLLRRTGKFLIQHVHEAARAAEGFERVLVATDDERIAAAVRSFGGEAVLTSPECPSGTDRVAEVARRIDAEIYVNLQGDEPEMRPAALTGLLRRLAGGAALSVSTLATPLSRRQDFENSAAVKVVVDREGRALYFSRAPIPWPREGGGAPAVARKHLGVYAYRREALLAFAETPVAPLEAVEKLEQLRFLWMGYEIGVVDVDFVPVGIDTPEDYDRFVERFCRQSDWRPSSI